MDPNSGATGLNQPSGQMKDPCGHIELTPQTWADLQIDQYIANYPGADKLTIQVSRPFPDPFNPSRF